MKSAFRPAALLSIVVCLCCQTALGDEKDNKAEKKEKSVSVSARVVGGAGQGVGIHAAKQPGEFTVPKGQIATGLKYSAHDPKSNFKSDKLTKSSIYSVTEKKYMDVPEDGKGLELPPGKYKFIVGGHPGAYGSLSFKLVEGEIGCGNDKKQGKGEKPNVLATKVEYVGKDGTRTAIEGFTKDSPLGIVYRDGKLTANHTATVFGPEWKNLRKQWTTTVDGSVKNGEVSGTYTMFYTLTDFADKTIAGGLMNYKRWTTGKLSGKVGKDGKTTVTVSDLSVKLMGREYGGSYDSSTGTSKLYVLKPWQEEPANLPPGLTIQFDMQLPPEK